MTTCSKCGKDLKTGSKFCSSSCSTGSRYPEGGSEQTRAIWYALEAKYPDKVIPYGITSRMAAEYGLSRQRFNMLVKKGGFTIAKQTTIDKAVAV